MKKSLIKFLTLIIAFSFSLQLQAISEPDIRYVKRDLTPKESLQKTVVEPDYLNAPVNFNHGYKISPSGFVTQSTYKVNAFFPSTKTINEINSFPGNRGPGQLVIYKPQWAKRTGTNEFGKEAVVMCDTVEKITGADSFIPENGYVISGHGDAKTWINNNIKIGTKIILDETNSKITAYTTVESFRYQAKAKIAELEGILESAKTYNFVIDDKKVRAYIKKSRLYLRKADGNNSASLAYALASIDMASKGLSYSMPYVENELHGVWVRPTEKNNAEVDATFNELEKAGLNAVFLETYFHGKTIFPSDVMRKNGFSRQNPNFVGFDPLASYVAQAEKRNMQLHIWFESFYIGNKTPSNDFENILSVKPMWGNKYKASVNSLQPVQHPTEHKGYFLDPANPEVVAFLNDLVLEISGKYDVSGFNIDYVRYPQSQKPTSPSYEASNWGYTDYARSEFKSQYGIDPLDIKYGTPQWQKWDLYRQDKIATYISTLKNSLKDRGVMLSAVVFPDEESCIETKQQNWGKWSELGYIDAITPLILTSDNELSQIMMRNIKKKAGQKVKVYPGLFVGFMDGEPEDLLRQIRVLRNEKLDGAVLFDYAHLEKRYVDILKSCVFADPCY